VVLLRNRDRLPLLWPPVFDHLASIIRGKGVSITEKHLVVVVWQMATKAQILRGAQTGCSPSGLCRAITTAL